VHDPAVLEIIEGLLNLCVAREQENARLSQKLEELQQQHSKLSAHLLEVRKVNFGATGAEKRGILVADQSEFMRHRLVELLTSNGYLVVAEADNGFKTIQLFQEKRPAIVTMNLDLPVIDGYEATRQIKKIDPDAMVIIISDVLDRSMILGALSAGAVDFLVKPLHVDRFLQRIGNLFARIGVPGKAANPTG